MKRKVVPTGSRVPEFRTLEERLWWSRETAPLTQSELAAMLGISKRTVQNYEAGVGHPSDARLLLWANACNVDYRWLAGDFYGSPDPGNPAVSGDVTGHSLSSPRYQFSRNVTAPMPPVTQAA